MFFYKVIEKVKADTMYTRGIFDYNEITALDTPFLFTVGNIIDVGREYKIYGIVYKHDREILLYVERHYGNP